MKRQPLPKTPVGDSVAAMMRRGVSIAESHLITASARCGIGKRWGDEPAGC
ncbi:MAG TPA: hypothetical protein VF645_00775 [Allosphingosinicella sp.]|jgi:hypothetical protein